MMAQKHLRHGATLPLPLIERFGLVPKLHRSEIYCHGFVECFVEKKNGKKIKLGTEILV